MSEETTRESAWAEYRDATASHNIPYGSSIFAGGWDAHAALAAPAGKAEEDDHLIRACLDALAGLGLSALQKDKIITDLQAALAPAGKAETPLLVARVMERWGRHNATIRLGEGGWDWESLAEAAVQELLAAPVAGKAVQGDDDLLTASDGLGLS